jgi:phosphoribosylformylglycinamidine cyclo-ligase
MEDVAMAMDRYQQRGVSSGKEDVTEATKSLSKGLVPGAFCKIWPDILTGDPDYGLIFHGDGPGTKLALAYLAEKVGADVISKWKIWTGINMDSITMNIDDMFCAGARNNFLLVNLLGRNAHLIPGRTVTAIIEGAQRVCDFLSSLGIKCLNCGGETADIPDLVRTLSMDHAVITRLRLDEVIDTSRVEIGDVIVGFSSTGQATWEDGPNSGIGSNGLTNARHDALHPDYERFTETYAQETDPDLIYCGKYHLDDPLPGDEENFTIGSALLSPTRTYAPLMQKMFRRLHRQKIHALINCTGGGQTKIGKFGPEGICYKKDNLFPVPPLFQMLHQVRKLPWDQMYKAYSMGHRLEAVVPTDCANQCIDISAECGIEARVIGHVERMNESGRMVLIETEQGKFPYRFKTE